jgi:basic membrane protein A
VAREVRGGGFTPRVVSLGVRDNVVRLVLNPVLEPRIPVSVRATIDSVQRRLYDGSLRLVDSTGAFVAP